MNSKVLTLAVDSRPKRILCTTDCRRKGSVWAEHELYPDEMVMNISVDRS